MKGLLKRDFIIPEFPRVRGGVDLVEIPDGTALPRDAIIVEDAKSGKRGRPRKVNLPDELDEE